MLIAGRKARSVERACRRAAPCLLILFGFLALSGFADAADTKLCDSYAKQAAHEAQLAERFKCRFRGPRWGKDIEAHRAWCLRGAKTAVQAEATARTKDLRLCLCEWYAEEATAQAAVNVTRNCHFTGPRWTPDRSAHYRWCVLAEAPLATLESEIKTRRELLAKCSS